MDGSISRRAQLISFYVSQSFIYNIRMRIISSQSLLEGADKIRFLFELLRDTIFDKSDQEESQNIKNEGEIANSIVNPSYSKRKHRRIIDNEPRVWLVYRTIRFLRQKSRIIVQ